jgi:hypothetical protein
MSSTSLTHPAPISADVLLIPSRDAARMLSVSERTLFAMTAPRGPIGAVKIGRAESKNPRVLYSVEMLKAWIASKTASVTDAADSQTC